MFFGEKFRRRYALTKQGIVNVKKATFWTVIVNLIVMGGMGILYFLMMQFMNTLTSGADLPKAGMYIAAVIAFIAGVIITAVIYKWRDRRQKQ